MPSHPHLRALAVLLAVSLSIAAAATAGATGRGGADRPGIAHPVPGERVFPEGIAVTRNGRRFLVGSTTDGTIFRGEVGRRDRAAEVLLPGGADGRSTAVGLEVDRGRLFVAGGATGAVFVYDLRRRALVRRFDTGTGGFLDDVAIAPNGDAYVTDSQRPSLFRIPADAVQAGVGDTQSLAPWLTYPGFQAGFNANGIVAVDRRTLVYVQTNTGTLHRIDLPTQSVQAIDLGGAALTSADGLALLGRDLYVVRNLPGSIAKVRLSPDARTGRIVSETTDPSFRHPTTAAVVGRRLLVVNSQFDKRSAGQPPGLPFTVSSIRRP